MNTLVLHRAAFGKWESGDMMREKRLMKIAVSAAVLLCICTGACACDVMKTDTDTDRELNKEPGSSAVIEEERSEPSFIGVSDIYMVKGMWVDYLEGISAYDALGQELTDRIVVDASKVITDECGEYELFYFVEDIEGNQAQTRTTVHVVEGEAAMGIILEENQPAFARIGYDGEETDSLGSGFIAGITETGIFLFTNAHVVGDEDTVWVFFCGGEEIQGEVLGRQEEPDMALVFVPLERVNEELLSRLKVVDMDLAYWSGLDPNNLPAAGYRCLNPDGSLWVEETGKILAKQEYLWALDYAVVKYSMENKNGVSGSAIIDESGKLIAMALGVSIEGGTTESWAIGLPDLIKFYERITGRSPGYCSPA